MQSYVDTVSLIVALPLQVAALVAASGGEVSPEKPYAELWYASRKTPMCFKCFAHYQVRVQHIEHRYPGITA